MKKSEREIVYSILLECEKAGERSRSFSAVKDHLDRYAELSDAQRSFIKRMAAGCLGDRLRLDAVINRFSKQPAEKMRPAVRTILRMGIYQILFMDAVSDAAACSGQVELARKVGLSSMTGFVNGLLRNVARNRESVLRETIEQGSREVRYSVPEWILRMWESQYGSEKAGEIAEASDEIHPVTLRISETVSEAERQELIRRMEEKGAEITVSAILPYALNIRGAAVIKDLPGFSEGKVTVQDVSSMLVAEAMDIRGGEIILDVCAAPGGKTAHAADKLRKNGRGGHVFAFDRSAGKIKKIEENLKRLRLADYVTADAADASVPGRKYPSSADILLCDVPCSGLGVLSRKRDIRYRLRPEDIQELNTLQKAIVSNAVKYLRKGGILIYSTCTVDRTENEDMACFIEEELGLLPDPLDGLLPGNLGAEGNRLQLFPGEHGTDGFFIARFRKPSGDGEKRENDDRP